ncbi:unnamed protein product [Alternaria alternata]
MTFSRIFQSLFALLTISVPATNAQQTFFDAIGGRTVRASGSNLVGYGNINNNNCWKHIEGQACEDVKIHDASSTAFLACGNSTQRQNAWYPPIENRDRSSEQAIHEYFLKYDIERNLTTRLQLENWNQGDDLVLHGLDIWQSDESPNEIRLFAVNHGRKGETIALFSHTLGTTTLRFLEEFQHPSIKTPNAVTAAGPRSFYVSNDHYFYNGTFREFEVANRPFKWATDVVHCAVRNLTLDCRSVTPPNAHPGANGILLIDDGRTLMVNDFALETVTAYDVEPTSGDLTFSSRIAIGAGIDNLSIESSSGDIFIAGKLYSMAILFYRAADLYCSFP